MKKKAIVIATALLVLFAVGVVFAQVCVISTVTVGGYGTKTLTFKNNSTEPQFVRIEVKWDDNKYSREFGKTVRAGFWINEGKKTAKFYPGEDTEKVDGIISSIKECF